MKQYFMETRGYYVYGREDYIPQKAKYVHDHERVCSANAAALLFYTLSNTRTQTRDLGSFLLGNSGYMTSPCARVYDVNNKYYVDIYW